MEVPSASLYLESSNIRRAFLAAGAGGLILLSACGGNIDSQESAATAATSSSTDESPAPASEPTLSEEQQAERLEGNGDTVTLTFDHLGSSYKEIFVYANPFESGKGPAISTPVDGELFEADCYTVGRLLTPPEDPDRQTDKWYLGITPNGTRAFGTAAYFEDFEEPIKTGEVEECQVG